MPRPAVFLDRDGVLIQDLDFVLEPADLRPLPGVPSALATLRAAGFALVVATNQAVVARGMISEAGLGRLHEELKRRLRDLGAPPLDAVYYCPHHPHSDLAEYRVLCDCRKPRPGMLRRAAQELGVDLSRSFMVGDRMTDVLAGCAAGCRTVLVDGPKTTAPQIVTVDPLDAGCKADYVCGDLLAAAHWIVKSS